MDTSRYEAIEKRIEEGDVVVDFVINGKEYKAKVVGFNHDIGATFVDANNPDIYLVCTHGKLSPIYKDLNPGETGIKLYLDIMDLLLIGIEKELVDWDKMTEDLLGPSNFADEMFGRFSPATNERCSFNQ